MKTKEFLLVLVLSISLIIISCKPDDPEMPKGSNSELTEANIQNLLINQVDGLIIPAAQSYQTQMEELLSSAVDFVSDVTEEKLISLRIAYLETNSSFQSVAVHNYFATANLDLINTTNLYPIDTALLDEFIDTESYDFNVTTQLRANGFPALDYLLYGPDDPVTIFASSTKTSAFLVELVTAMKEKSDLLLESWAGELRDNFVDNGGVELGSSVSVQLNEVMFYYEDHIRGNKVGIPVGRLGPNDTPFDVDGTKIEGYYQSLFDGNDNIALNLLKVAIEEMEDVYLGVSADGEDGVGYEDLLLSIDQESLDFDIKTQYQAIYNNIENRTSILGDEVLYDSIQGLVTLYKSDLFPVLNVQDADGSNDGD